MSSRDPDYTHRFEFPLYGTGKRLPPQIETRRNRQRCDSGRSRTGPTSRDWPSCTTKSYLSFALRSHATTAVKIVGPYNITYARVWLYTTRLDLRYLNRYLRRSIRPVPKSADCFCNTAVSFGSYANVVTRSVHGPLTISAYTRTEWSFCSIYRPRRVRFLLTHAHTRTRTLVKEEPRARSAREILSTQVRDVEGEPRSRLKNDNFRPLPHSFTLFLRAFSARRFIIIFVFFFF